VKNCSNCHTEPLFSDFKFRSNGLAVDPRLRDSGRAHITREPGDVYRFKTPSLRNVALTRPYMHDGRFETLEECLNHYTADNKNPTNLDPLLNYPLPLDPQQKKDIISFLQTLSDFNFTKDSRFANPNFQ
jgi:cytochrome c peroxidase